MGQQLTEQNRRDLRRCIRAAQLNLRLAWAGALDNAAERQLRLAEKSMAGALEIIGPETDDVQTWEATP